MIASGSQYIQLFTSSPDILHLAWGQEKKKANTILSTTPCIFQASSGWTWHRFGARLAPHLSERGEAVLTQLMSHPLPQGEKAAPLAAFCTCLPAVSCSRCL